MRTLLTGEIEGDCSEVGEGVADSDGDKEAAGDSSGVTAGDGVVESCPSATEDKATIRTANVTLAVMSSKMETSLTL